MPGTACHADRTGDTRVSQAHRVDTASAAQASRIRRSEKRPRRSARTPTGSDSTASGVVTHMARLTGNYPRGNERTARDHPRNRRG